MAWSYIRIVLFITAFFIGLFFFGSSGESAHPKINTAQRVREPIEKQCVDTRFTLIRTEPKVVVPRDRITGM
jgi:hypothetical protein